MLREAFNRVQDTGSQKDWGTTPNARIYFDLSHPGGQNFDPARKNPSVFPN
jgi:Mn-containing catalase